MAREGEVEKAQATREQYVNLVCQSYESSRDTFAPWFEKASRWYRLHRGVQQGKYVQNRANITVPIAFSIQQSWLSKTVNLLTGRPDMVKFVAVGPEDQKIARKRDALINVQLDDCKTFDKSTRLLGGAGICGTAFYRTFWDVQVSDIDFRADFGTGEQQFNGSEVSFDGPQWEPVSEFHAFPCPGFPRIDESPWFVHRYMVEREDVNRLIESGFYDKAAREHMAQTGGEIPASDVTTVHDNPATGYQAELYRSRKDFDRPVEILEYWGRVPRSMSVGGAISLVVTVANRQVLLRARKNPHGKIPFGSFSPMPDPRYLHGPSKIEVIEKLQIATNAFASQKADVLSLFADPQFFYNRRGVVDPRKLVSRPGKWHGFDGEVDDKQVSPVTPDLRALVNLYTELEQHDQWMQKGSGAIDDVTQGFTAADRETARSFVGRQEAAGTRVLMETKVSEALWLVPMVMDFVRLNRKFLTFPKQLRMLGSAAVLDPWTLQPVPNETDPMMVNDMLPDYSARAVGPTMGVTKAEMRDGLLLIGQMAQANPIGAAILNWFTYFREVMFLTGVPNPDELLNTDPLIQGAIQNAMAGGQAGGAPGGAMNGAGGLSVVPGMQGPKVPAMA